MGEADILLTLIPGTWEPLLDAILPTPRVIKIFRRSFDLNMKKFQVMADWEDRIPPGMSIERIDGTLADRLEGDISATWRSVDDFCANGFGYCLLDGDDIVSACISAFIARGEVEIGVHTVETFRRRGYASLTASALIQHCLDNALVPNWECFWDNAPSVALAHKLGFEVNDDSADILLGRSTSLRKGMTWNTIFRSIRHMVIRKSDLLTVGPPPEPHGFADFWRSTYAETLQVPLNLEITSRPNIEAEYQVFRVSFDTWGDMRIGGWLLVPADGEIRGGAVVGHGYGGREAPDLDPPLTHRVLIFPCAPGFNLSARVDIPDNSQEHVVYGMASRETYILRHSTAALWSAASVLLELHPQVEGNIVYSGGSFGGGLGALALPWDARFVKAHLGVPTFGHHPIRLQCQCQGSGEAVRRYYEKHPEVVNVLAFYDAAVSAGHIDIPVLVSPALFDPAVPPPGQFAVANAIPDHQLFIFSAGHFTHAGEVQENQAFRDVLERWFLL